MTKLSTTLKKEFFELLPPTIYFFVALHIVMFIRVLMLERTGVAPSSSISIAVAALILGKAVLIARLFITWSVLLIFGGKPAALSRATRSYWRKSSGRISGLSRSFCSC